MMNTNPYEVLPEQIDILVDEIEKARLVAQRFGYSEGYYDGLRMALDIIWGNVD